MIARDPADRPRDAYVVHDALDAVLQRLTGEVPAPASDLDLARRHEPPASFRLPDLDGDDRRRGSRERGRRLAPVVARGGAHGAAPGEIAERWHNTLGDLERHVETAGRAQGREPDGVRRARELAESARGLLASLERAKAAVAAIRPTSIRSRRGRAASGRRSATPSTRCRAIGRESWPTSRPSARCEAASSRSWRPPLRPTSTTARPWHGSPRRCEAERTRASAMAADLELPDRDPRAAARRAERRARGRARERDRPARGRPVGGAPHHRRARADDGRRGELFVAAAQPPLRAPGARGNRLRGR